MTIESLRNLVSIHGAGLLPRGHEIVSLTTPNSASTMFYLLKNGQIQLDRMLKVTEKDLKENPDVDYNDMAKEIVKYCALIA